MAYACHVCRGSFYAVLYTVHYLKFALILIPAFLANCLINNFSIMYKFKQDLAMTYFDGCSKKTAGAAEAEWKASLLVFPK